MDTGEFLLGTVAVTPVLFESDGTRDPQTQNWSAAEIDQVLAKVAEGVNWWSDMLATLNTVHTLEFVIDDTFAVDPVETRYEPIDRSSTDFNLYVGDFITAQGHGDVNSIEEGVRRFNNDQRAKLGTDWSFTIFIVDSSDDADGLFASGMSFAAAFAYAGGLFIVTPSTRPASTIAHEMGHIFWARDEYSGGTWSERRGYYDTQNLNAPDNPAPDFQQEISVMRGGVPLTAAYQQHVSPDSTLAMIGWQDSDGDGIFDLADVPLQLEGSGYYDAATSLYHFQADASAVPLMNRNSSGPQSDITLNQINQLQYRLDDGAWLVAAQPDAQRASFDLSLNLTSSFDKIEWRVIDLATGVTSASLEGTSLLPALSASSLSGIAFVDQNGDRVRNPGEEPLAKTEVVVRNADGSSLPQGVVQASSFGDGPLPSDLTGVTLAADGLVHDVQVGSFVSSLSGVGRVFHAFDQQRNKWIDRWSSKVAFQADFDQPLGDVQIDAIGIGGGSFARIEAYDVAGQLITRTTSEELADLQRTTIRVADPLGRIASVRVFGHAGSSVALDRLQFGSLGRVVTDASGVWQIPNLPAGNYLVELTPERVIHQFQTGSQVIQVAAGASSLVQAAANRIDSNRHNGGLAEDVNGDGKISASDALAIINDLARYTPRLLSPSDPTVFDVDVSNDGAVSALDALLVINFLGRADGGANELVSGEDPSPIPISVMASSDEIGWEPAEPIQSQMVNSAGSSSSGESIDGESADSTEEREFGGNSLPGKIRAFFQRAPQIHPETPPGEEPQAAATSQTEPAIDSLSLELSEPFAPKAI